MDIISQDDELDGALFTGGVVEFKLLDNMLELGQLFGYGATFGSADGQGDTIRQGAFADTLGRHAQAGTAPAMVWSHRQAEPIGKWTAMGEDGRGLRVRGQLNLETIAGRKAHAHLKAGDISGLSIGYVVPPGGAAARRGGRTLSKLDLHEVSLVAIRLTRNRGSIRPSRSRTAGSWRISSRPPDCPAQRPGGSRPAASQPSRAKTTTRPVSISAASPRSSLRI